MSQSPTRSRLDELLPLVYDQLRNYASRALNAERRGFTLQTTDLVHEVYLRLSQLQQIQWNNDQDIMRTAVGIMRRVLIDVARAKKSAKRTPPSEPWRLAAETDDAQNVDLLDLDEALLRLTNLDARKTDIVELRYFGGMTNEEVAHTLGISVATVKREWALAKAWLYRELKDETAS